jgi:hypothetical protein
MWDYRIANRQGHGDGCQQHQWLTEQKQKEGKREQNTGKTAKSGERKE